MRVCAIAIVAASLLPIAQFPANAQFPADPLFFIGEAREVLTGSGRFGTSVGRAGDVNDDGFADVIIGAPEFLVGGNPQGAAFVFHGRTYGIPNGSNTNPDAQLTGGQTGPKFGNSVAGAGDVNGDGYDDVIVGAPFHDAGQGAWGGAFIFLGGPSGIADTNPAGAATRLLADQESEFGWSVAGAGDVNDDGYDDVIVGAPKYSAGSAQEGAAFLFLGSATGIADGGPLTASARFESDDPGANLGVSVAGAGDVNHDGYDDVIVGADFLTSTLVDQGGALVFLGSASGIANGSPATAAATLLADQAQASFGFSVALAADVNFDGFDDVIIGAPRYDAEASNSGAAFIFEGSASGIASGDASSADTRLWDKVANGLFGYAVGGVGNVTEKTGHCCNDVIVGTPRERAWVFAGGGSGIQNGGIYIAVGGMLPTPTTVDADFGSALAGVGDLDGDGFDDIIVGGPNFPSGTDVGRAFVYRSGEDPPRQFTVPSLGPLALGALVALIAAASVSHLRRRAS